MNAAASWIGVIVRMGPEMVTRTINVDTECPIDHLQWGGMRPQEGQIERPGQRDSVETRHKESYFTDVMHLSILTQRVFVIAETRL